jgi:hypothetical protein
MYKKELLIRSIKLLDISLLGIYYFIGGVILSIMIDKLFSKYDEEIYEKKTIMEIFIECCLYISLIMVCVYILRNIIELIPFPLHGYYDYDHYKVREIRGGVLISFAIVTFQPNLKDKVNKLVNKIINNKILIK